MSKRDEILDHYTDLNLMFLDPPELDVAIIGIGSRCGMEPVVVYDRAALIDTFMNLNDWDYEEADEWVCVNVEGAYVGEYTPIIMGHV